MMSDSVREIHPDWQAYPIVVPGLWFRTPRMRGKYCHVIITSLLTRHRIFHYIWRRVSRGGESGWDIRSRGPAMDFPASDYSLSKCAYGARGFNKIEVFYCTTEHRASMR